MDWVSIRMEHLFNHKGLNDICLHQPGLNETLLHQSKSFRIRKNIRIPCLSCPQRLHCTASHSDCRYMKHNRDSTNLILWLFDRLWQLKLVAKHSKTIRGRTREQVHSNSFTERVRNWSFVGFKLSRMQRSYKLFRIRKFRIHNLSVIILCRIHVPLCKR